MTSHPVSDEVAATRCAFAAGGDEATHPVLTSVFDRARWLNPLLWSAMCDGGERDGETTALGAVRP